MKMPFLSQTPEHRERKKCDVVVAGVVATWNGGVKW
jgi:hypothetical protein